MEVDVLLNSYWSKSDAFLLPFTGMKKVEEFDVGAFMFWENYTIEDYKLIVKIEYGCRYDEFETYLKERLLVESNKVIQVYPYEGFSIFIFDIADWYEDIETLLNGKYSMFTRKAKDTIERYHMYYEDGKPQVDINIFTCLYPNSKESVLDGMTAIDYVIKNYIMVGTPSKLDLETAKIMKSGGQVCSIYDKKEETLVLDRQLDKELVME